MTPDLRNDHTPESPRKGWDEQFQAMAERGDDALLMPETATEWDESEW